MPIIRVPFEPSEMMLLRRAIRRALGKSVSLRDLPVLTEGLMADVIGQLAKKARFVLTLKHISDAAEAAGITGKGDEEEEEPEGKKTKKRPAKGKKEKKASTDDELLVEIDEAFGEGGTEVVSSEEEIDEEIQRLAEIDG